MLEAYLHFCANLILFTAGTAVLLLWIVGLVAVSIEIHDVIKEHYLTKEEEDD